MKKKPVSPKTFARFQKVASKYRGVVESAEFIPLGTHMVFDGPQGGWEVRVKFPGYDRSLLPCIGLNIDQVIDDIKGSGLEALRLIKRPDLSIPKNDDEWKDLARRLYKDVVQLMDLEQRATKIEDRDYKAAWEIIQELREGDIERLNEGLKRVKKS